MPKSTTKIRSSRTSAKIRTPATAACEIGAGQVIEELQALFHRLKIDVRIPRSTAKIRTNRLDCSPSRLYPHVAAIGELLTLWHQDPDYLDDKGNPAEIRSLGRSPSFQSLAMRMVPSIDDSYLLSELVRLGAVSMSARKRVCVNTRSFPIYEDKGLAAQHTLASLHGFIVTLGHNLESRASNSAQLFHRIARSNNFDRREVPALKVRIKRHGQSFLESFDDWLIKRSISERRRSSLVEKPAKVSIGIYVTVEGR